MLRIGLRIGSVDRKGLRKTIRGKDRDLCSLFTDPCVLQEILDFDSAVPGVKVLDCSKRLTGEIDYSQAA